MILRLAFRTLLARPPHDLHSTGTGVVVVTHDPSVAARAHRLIRMRDGRIVEDTTR